MEPITTARPGPVRPVRTPGGFTFYMGTHMPHWLRGLPGFAPVPMCVSRVRLVGYKGPMPRAVAPVIIDSGGFTALKERADWGLTARQFVTQVRRIVDEVGPQVQWCAPMDWMCERFMVAGTGLSVAEHQRRSVESALELRMIAPDLPIILVAQGDPGDPDTHLRCLDLFERAGIDLEKEVVIGIGSVCRVQATAPIAELFATLADRFAGTGVRFHGFGVKTEGLALYAQGLASADSLAWSKGGKHAGPCRHGSAAKTEANCPHVAHAWRASVLGAAARSTPKRWEAFVRSCRDGTPDPLFDLMPPLPPRVLSGEALARVVAEYAPQYYDADGSWSLGIETREGGRVTGTVSAQGRGGLAALIGAFRSAMAAQERHPF